MLSSDKNNCVLILAYVCKSRREIDPEFDECRETLVSFVASTTKQGDPKTELTMLPTVVLTCAQSLSRENLAPV